MTEIIKVNPEDPEEELIEKAVRIIKKGGIVAFPTETVYGLGGDGKSEKAVRRIFELKGRPPGKPLILHLSSVEDAEKVWREIPEEAFLLMEAFWPGPLTIVLKKSPEIPKITSGGRETIGARVPDHPVALSLISKARTPIAAPSANPSGRPSPVRPEDVIKYFYGKIEAIIDGGETRTGIESTVIDLTERPPKILRLGAISPSEILKVLRKEGIEEVSLPEVPEKYSLKVKVILAVEKDPVELAEEFSRKGKTFLALFSGKVPQEIRGISFQGSLEEMARRIFPLILDCEKEGYDYLIVQAPPEEGIGRALRDRLFRASRKVF